MRRALIGLALLACLAGLVVLWLTRPQGLSETEQALFSDTSGSALTGDATAGRLVYLAAGCGSCHQAKDADGDAKLVLAGGQAFPSPFGTFYAPNISQHPTAGIGTWTRSAFAAALRHGTSPRGEHYFPAFPYTSYARMANQDIADLFAYLQTLPASDVPSQPHAVQFPFNIRASLGVWKALFVNPDWVLQGDLSPQLERGRMLVEGLGHCAECHTPRNALGGLDRSAWLRGAPSPDGKGKIPSISPDDFTWSQGDIAYYLETGFTPEFDSAGGHMAFVIENFSQLPASDREAVAAYLKALPGGE